MKNFGISIKFGVLTAIALIVYFLFLGMLGVNTNPFYSFFNAVIYVSFLSLSFRNLQEKEPGRVSYKRGFEVPFFAGIVATAIFSIFFITYFAYVPDFSKELLKNIGEFANMGGIFLTVVTMGIVTSLVVAFSLMQLHKKELVKVPKDNT